MANSKPDIKGSRISAAAKSKVMRAKKSGSITGTQAQAIRKTLRAGGSTGLAKKTVGAKTLSNQVKRSTVRKAGGTTTQTTSKTGGKGPLAASNRLIRSGVTYANATNAQRKVLVAGAAKRNGR